MSREQLVKEIDALTAKARDITPAAASVLLTLSAALAERTENELAMYLKPYVGDQLLRLQSPKN